LLAAAQVTEAALSTTVQGVHASPALHVAPPAQKKPAAHTGRLVATASHVTETEFGTAVHAVTTPSTR
jgi:hypothetical protein